MAKFAATDFSVTLNGGTVSTNLNSVELSQEADDIETTNFGNSFRTRIGGLKSGSLTLNFMQDFGSGSIDELLNPLLGTIATVTIRPTAAAVSATNPEYAFNVLVTSYSPFASSVGDLATFSISVPVTGAIVRGTV